MENWRDTGWRVEISKGEKQIEVYFALYGTEGSWLLGIAPIGQPGFFAVRSLWGRILNRAWQRGPLEQPGYRPLPDLMRAWYCLTKVLNIKNRWRAVASHKRFLLPESR